LNLTEKAHICICETDVDLKTNPFCSQIKTDTKEHFMNQLRKTFTTYAALLSLGVAYIPAVSAQELVDTCEPSPLDQVVKPNSYERESILVEYGPDVNGEDGDAPLALVLKACQTDISWTIKTGTILCPEEHYQHTHHDWFANHLAKLSKVITAGAVTLGAAAATYYFYSKWAPVNAPALPATGELGNVQLTPTQDAEFLAHWTAQLQEERRLMERLLGPQLERFYDLPSEEQREFKGKLFYRHYRNEALPQLYSSDGNPI